MPAIQVGSFVSFRGTLKRRQVVVSGPVIETATKTRRLPKKLQKFKGLMHDKTSDMVVVADKKNRVVWTTSLSAVTFVREATKEELVAGRALRQEIESNNVQHKAAREERNEDAAIDNGLVNLKPGDPILVTFKGNVVREVEFVGWTESKRIRFRQHGRERLSFPQYVKPVSN